MKSITFDLLQVAFAKCNIDFDLKISGTPMPYGLQVSLTGKMKSTSNDIPLVPYEVIVPQELIIRSPTVLTHPNTIAQQLWEALKKHRVRVDVLGEASKFYMVVHGKLKQVGPS